MAWRLITGRLPARPSRHRVAVWQELRSLGAMTLQEQSLERFARQVFRVRGRP